MSRLIFSSAALALSVFMAAAPAAFAENRRFAIRGEGSASAPPDVARLSTSVDATAATPQEAIAQNAALMNEVFAALKAAKIEEEDIRTSSFRLYPHTREELKPDGRGIVKVAVYSVSNTISIRLRDVSMVGSTIDALVSAGVNRSAGVSFHIRDQEELRKTALRRAALDARAKAEQYAEVLGVKLGQLLSLSESGFSSSRDEEHLAASRASAESTPISSGLQSVSTSVNTVWEIVD